MPSLRPLSNFNETRAKTSTLRPSAGCRPAQATRQLCAAPVSVAAGSRNTPPPPQPPSSNSSKSKPFKISASSLPTMIAGLSSGVLIGAASVHLGTDHATTTSFATAAASAVDSLKEFGPADMIAQSFGPTRPLWSMMLNPQTHHHTSTAIQHFSNSQPSLLDDAREAAEDAVDAARGAVGKVCDGYNRWLEESPLLCKIVTGNFFTVAGDMLAQLGLGGGGGHGGEVEPSSSSTSSSSGKGRRVDWMRTGRLCLETSAIGTPMGHWWFGLLDSHIMPEDPHCPAAVLTKMLADQMLFAPFGLALFFVVIKLLEGRPKGIATALKTSYVRALLGGYLLWPAAGILNFALLPNEYRLLFNNCVNILWTCFLSIMSSDGDAAAELTDESNAAAATAAVLHSSHAAAVETAVVVAAISIAAATGRPSFSAAAGLAVAAIESVLSATHGSQAEPRPAAVARELVSSAPMVPAVQFAGGATVSLGGPCLELCEQPVDALYETR